MLQNVQHIPDLPTGLLGQDRPVCLVLPNRVVGELPAADGCFRQQFQGDHVAVIAQDHSQPTLVVFEIHLPSDAEHVPGIHRIDVIHGRFVPIVPAQMLVEPIEELLNMVRDATAKAAEHLLADTLRNLKIVGLGQLAEASDRSRFIPGPQLERCEDVGMGAQLGLLQDRFQAHAARHHESDAISMRLRVLPKPAQESVGNPACAPA